jgi:acyl-CoA thioesterase-1
MMAGSVEAEGMTFQMDRFADILKSALTALVILLAITTPGSAQQSAEECRIAVLGDSLTAAYGLDVADGFPARLEQALQKKGYDCAVLDAGVSGDTSAGGLTRLDWMMADRPSHVIVELGGNDALRALPPEQMAQNLDQIITRLKDEGIPVLLTGMLAPPNLGREYGDAFAAVFPALAEKHDVPLYPFFLDGVAGELDLNQGDGIHPNARGVEIIVERILPTVTNWLDATS